ncbi:hypothetical protein ACFV0H_31340 [Streptomyces erythrochromogenes]|uniref:hypothetical protein n=1 Tax=Streptomyces erythrochromogenes TaxID=285574 RepID=UPI0036988183
MTPGVRRAALCSGGTIAVLAVVAFVAQVGQVVPWWVLVPGGVLVAGLAGLAGARMGREDAVRAQALEPGETVLGAHAVRPPYANHDPVGVYETPPFQLRVTTRGMQLWERSVLLWNHPWPELRVVVDGLRLRVRHEGRDAGVMLLERPGAEHEVLLTARKYGAG